MAVGICICMSFLLILIFIFSYEVVNDGNWHSIELITVKQNFTMRIDRGTARSIVNDGVNEYLQLSAPLFIGGLPKEAAESANKRWHLRDTGSFSGKLYYLIFLMVQVMKIKIKRYA